MLVGQMQELKTEQVLVNASLLFYAEHPYIPILVAATICLVFY